MSKKNHNKATNTIPAVETAATEIQAVETEVTPVAETPAVVAEAIPAADGKITIQFKGKDVRVKQIAPGAFQKTASIFYVRDSVTGEIGYCFPERMVQLLKKHNGDLSNYKNRESKAKERADLKVSKATKKAERDAERAAKAVEVAAKLTSVVAAPIAPEATVEAAEDAPAYVDTVTSGVLVEA